MSTDTTGLNELPPGVDFTDPDFLQRAVPEAEFALLRRTAPVWWNAQQPGESPFDDGGFWVLSRYHDVRAVSRNSEDWSSGVNGAILRYPDGMTAEQMALPKTMLINQDPPAHTRLRKIVSRLFTPRAVADLEQGLRDAARVTVEAARDKGAGEFVTDIASVVPRRAIADLLGIPEADREQVLRWADAAVNFDDPDPAHDPVMANAMLLGYAHDIAQDRLKHPADDIISRLVHADMDGEQMTELEFGMFVLILAVAGNDTSKNAIAHAMNAFFDNPDQWELYKKERPWSTADEVVRWCTPIYGVQRTALRDAEIAGTAIRTGQRVGLFFSSANFDETVFEDPFRFDITRDPNPHLGFGGQGIHYCLGANLAKLEIRIVLEAIADVIPDIHKLGEPRRVRSGLINSIDTFPMQYRSPDVVLP